MVPFRREDASVVVQDASHAATGAATTQSNQEGPVAAFDAFSDGTPWYLGCYAIFHGGQARLELCYVGC